MAHFIQMKGNTCIGPVLVVNNEVLNNAEGLSGEDLGISFLKSLYGEDTEWRQTSYNGNFRRFYAGVGMVYDPVKDEFIVPVATTPTTDAPTV